MSDEPTICDECRHSFQYWFHGEDNIYCRHGCKLVETIDFVSGLRLLDYDVEPVKCREKNHGRCEDYEYEPVVAEKKHWWQR